MSRKYTCMMSRKYKRFPVTTLFIPRVSMLRSSAEWSTFLLHNIMLPQPAPSGCTILEALVQLWPGYKATYAYSQIRGTTFFPFKLKITSKNNNKKKAWILVILSNLYSQKHCMWLHVFHLLGEIFTS